MALKMQILGFDVNPELVASLEANQYTVTAKNLVSMTEVFDFELTVVTRGKRNDIG